jgi:hypothetical protein
LLNVVIPLKASAVMFPVSKCPDPASVIVVVPLKILPPVPELSVAPFFLIIVIPL